MSRPPVHLLGTPRADLGPEPVRFRPDRPHKLLAHLAYCRDWVGRDRLAFLFWPDHPSTAARRNLRKVVHRVRRLAWHPALEADDHAARWPVETDVTAFLAAAERQDWGTALAHYGGPLLEGLDGADAEFDAWLAIERERLEDAWRHAILARAAELEPRDPHAACEVLAPLLARQPFDEAAETALLRALLRAGERTRAVAACRAFRARLEEEFGLEPTGDFQRLALALAGDDADAEAALRELVGPPAPVAGPAAPPRAPHPPDALTSFVGREAELEALGELLARPDGRLVTLVGSGGIGKSRLAARAARALADRFPDGAAFVPLETLSTPEAIPAAIGEALGLALREPGDGSGPIERLERALGERRLLLVLDNFEHLTAGAPLVARLVERCPALHLLVTSREPLGLHEERLLRLDGLPYPREALPLEELGRSDAVRLFLDRARRVRHDFAPGPADVAPLLEICGALDGSPLGLELAAPWVRMLPLAEIAAEIRGDPDLLATEAPDVPARQRSLRATFEHSWGLLTAREREALRRLSAFRGGFTRDAARCVAEAPLPVLASLLDRSLVREASSGRYDLHPLVRQYAAEKLAADPVDREATEARHGAYYTQLIRSRRAAGPEPVAVDLENVRAAWRWALGRVRGEPLWHLTDALRRYYDRRARYAEGLELLAEGADRLAAEPAPDPATLGMLLVAEGWLQYREGRHDRAVAATRRGLERLTRRDRLGAWFGLNTLGAIAVREGAYGEARARFAEAYERIASLDGPAAASLNNLAVAARHLGDDEEAVRCLLRALAINRRQGETERVAMNLLNLAGIAAARGRPEEATALLEEGLGVARANDHGRLVAQTLSNLATVWLDRGDAARAQACLREALAGADAPGREFLRAELQVRLGRALLAGGETEAAHRALREGLGLFWTLERTPQVLEAVTYLGEWHAARGEPQRAARLWALVRDHPGAAAETRDEAHRRLLAVGASATAHDGGPDPDGGGELERVVAAALDPPRT